MNIEEFSNQFDILYNNVVSSQAPGIDEYEKSVFLTKAQEEIVRSYFNPTSNKLLQGFDGSPRRQYDFSSLIKNVTLTPVPEEVLDSLEYTKIDSRSKVYYMPSDYYLEVNNIITGTDSFKKKVSVVGLPMSYDVYNLYMTKAYQLPPKRCFWKLLSTLSNAPEEGYYYWIYGADSDDYITLKIPNTITSITITFDDQNPREELSSNKKSLTLYLDDQNYGFESSGYEWNGNTHFIWKMNLDATLLSNGSYKEITRVTSSTSTSLCEVIISSNYSSLTNSLRYVSRPAPIILCDLETGLSILGRDKKHGSDLPEALHEEILQRAVELARITYLGQPADIMTAGSISSTDIGVVPSSSKQQQ